MFCLREPILSVIPRVQVEELAGMGKEKNCSSR